MGKMRILLILLLICAPPLLAEPVVIGHPGTPALDRTTLERIYTGKIVELSGTRVTPVNLPPGNPVRARFLRLFLNQDDETYIGYWTVRRYVGKGKPPRELDSVEDILRYVSKTAGAIGYVDEQDVPTGVEILSRSP